MHSESCLAVCLSLSACMILLFWFLKDFGRSVSSQPTDRFWWSHTVLPQPSDDVPVRMDAQQGGQTTGGVGGCCLVGHSLHGGWEQKPELYPRGGDGGFWHWGRWPCICGKALGVPWAASQVPACSTSGSREGHSTSLLPGRAVWVGTWPGVQGKRLSSTQRVFMLCPVPSSPTQEEHEKPAVG